MTKKSENKREGLIKQLTKHQRIIGYLHYGHCFLDKDKKLEDLSDKELAEEFLTVGLGYIRKFNAHDEAIECIKIGHSFDPKDFDINFKFGSLLVEMNECLELAEKYLFHAFKLQPNHAELLNSIGKMYKLRNDKKKAVWYFLLSIYNDSLLRPPLKNLNEIFPEKSKYVSESMGFVLSFVESEPEWNSPKLLLALGVFLEYVKSYVGAYLCFSMALKEETNDCKILVPAGKFFNHTFNYNLGIELLQKAVKLEPDNFRGWGELGVVQLFYNSDINIAIHCFNKVLTNDPNATVCLDYLVQCHLILGQFSKAIFYCQKLLQLDKNNQKAQDYLTEIKEIQNILANKKLKISELKTLADEHDSINNVFIAFHLYNKIHELQPDDINIKIKLGIAYARTSRFQKSLDFLQEALDKVPNNNDLLITIEDVKSAIRDSQYTGEMDILKIKEKFSY